MCLILKQSWNKRACVMHGCVFAVVSLLSVSVCSGVLCISRACRLNCFPFCIYRCHTPLAWWEPYLPWPEEKGKRQLSTSLISRIHLMYVCLSLSFCLSVSFSSLTPPPPQPPPWPPLPPPPSLSPLLLSLSLSHSVCLSVCLSVSLL